MLYSRSWLLAGELLDGVSSGQLAESYGLIGGQVLPRLHKWIGVRGRLLVLPVVLVGGVGAIVASATLLVDGLAVRITLDRDTAWLRQDLPLPDG